MTLVAAAVPAAAWLLPSAGIGVPADWREGAEAQRERVRSALQALRGVDVLVVLAPGERTAVEEPSSTSLRPLGVPDPTPPTARAPDPRLRARVAGAVGDVAGPPTGPEVRVLLRLVADAAVDVGATALRLAPQADVDALAHRLRAALGVGTRVGVLAAGDLAATLDATSPGYHHPAAPGVEAGVVAALRRGGWPDEVDAERADALVLRGRTPLRALLALREAWGHARAPDHLHHAVLRGVGQVVATWTST